MTGLVGLVPALPPLPAAPALLRLEALAKEDGRLPSLAEEIGLTSGFGGGRPDMVGFYFLLSRNH